MGLRRICHRRIVDEVVTFRMQQRGTSMNCIDPVDRSYLHLSCLVITLMLLLLGHVHSRS